VSANAPVSVLDWVTAPTPQDKTKACGTVCQIIEYSNRTLAVLTFYCHRWDCAHCREANKKAIISKIIGKSVLWYTATIDAHDYGAVTKRISRAGSKYVAVGSGAEILMLTDKPVLENAKLLSKIHLEPLINKYLESESIYDYRHRRFRHSEGLFPAAQPINSENTHIKRKIAVDKLKKDVIIGLMDKGYMPVNHTGNVEYMRPYKALVNISTALEHDVSKVLWIE
jgi:hypothetical protein